MTPEEKDHIEFLVRQYHVVTEELIKALEKAEDKEVPAAIKGALILLARAIAQEWNSAF